MDDRDDRAHDQQRENDGNDPNGLKVEGGEHAAILAQPFRAEKSRRGGSAAPNPEAALWVDLPRIRATRTAIRAKAGVQYTARSGTRAVAQSFDRRAFRKCVFVSFSLGRVSTWNVLLVGYSQFSLWPFWGLAVMRGRSMRA